MNIRVRLSWTLHRGIISAYSDKFRLPEKLTTDTQRVDGIAVSTTIINIVKIVYPTKNGYLSENRESTNSVLLKICKSLIPSPTPMYFTGIFI